MEFNEYKEQIEDLFSEVESSVEYNTSIHWGLAFVEESGEVAKAIKKIHVFGEVTQVNLYNLKEELGDALMCLINIAHVNHIPIEEIMNINLSKMKSRKSKLINSKKSK